MQAQLGHAAGGHRQSWGVPSRAGGARRGQRCRPRGLRGCAGVVLGSAGAPRRGGPSPTRPDGGSCAAVWAKPPRTRTPTLFPPGELSLSFPKISPASFPASKFNRGQKPIAGVRAGRELNGREGRLTRCSGLELHAG